MPSQNRRAKTRLFNGRKQVPCCFCRRLLSFENATIEHVTPRAFGGDMHIDNLRISCRACNFRRGTEDFDTFQRRVRKDRKALIAWAANIPAEQLVPVITPEEAAERERLGLPRIMAGDPVSFEGKPK